MKPVETLAVGDVILPPGREISLWMRRAAAERGLPETALALTVTSVRQGTPDKLGPWIVVDGLMSEAWNNSANYARPQCMTFKARPGTNWPVWPVASYAS